jgi:hypothetical protein
MFVRRTISHTNTVIAINKNEREQAYIRSRVAVQEVNYVLYLDKSGNLKFEGTTQITENRHYPAQIEAPKEQDATEAILTMRDGGSSAREIERWLKYQNRAKSKDEQVSLRQIINKLNMYRQGWQENSKKVVDAETYPVEE